MSYKYLQHDTSNILRDTQQNIHPFKVTINYFTAH